MQMTSTAKHFEPTVISKASGSQYDQAFGTKVPCPPESASRAAINHPHKVSWADLIGTVRVQ